MPNNILQLSGLELFLIHKPRYLPSKSSYVMNWAGIPSHFSVAQISGGFIYMHGLQFDLRFGFNVTPDSLDVLAYLECSYFSELKNSKLVRIKNLSDFETLLDQDVLHRCPEGYVQQFKAEATQIMEVFLNQSKQPDFKEWANQSSLAATA